MRLQSPPWIVVQALVTVALLALAATVVYL